MDAFMDPDILFSRTIPLQKLNLQKIERFDVREAQADRGIQPWIILEQALLSADRKQAFVRAEPCIANTAEYRIAHGPVLDQLGIMGCDRHVRLRQDHLEVIEGRAEEWPFLVHFAKQL